MIRRPRPNRAARRRAAAIRTQHSGRSSALAVLTAGALALPGLAGSARGDSPVEEISADYSFTYYFEDDLPRSKVATGSVRERYEIESHQFQVKTPLTDRADLTLNVGYETMSGASPWFVEPDSNGKPVQVMSGATIDDERIDGLVAGNYYFDNGRVGLSTGISVEKDYTAVNGGFGGETHFNEKNTTLGAGFGFSLDTIEPTDADDFATRPNRKHKQSYSLFAEVSQILSRQSVIQSSLTFQHARGFLSDPYKLASVGGVNLADSRPDDRNQASLLTRYRRYFSGLDGTLHADYRFYLDDWDITSHTFELAWYQMLWEKFRLIPSVRYYSQSQADFYSPFYLQPRRDGLASSDYRLSPYGAISWRIKAETLPVEWPRRISWRGAISFERYVSDADYAIESVSVENPGLVSFNLLSVSLTGRF